MSRGGKRPGSGAKTTRRVNKHRAVYLFEDQPTSTERVRLLVDIGNEVCNALGSPHFDAEAVLDTLAPHRNNSSVSALMNALPSIVDRAKAAY